MYTHSPTVPRHIPGASTHIATLQKHDPVLPPVSPLRLTLPPNAHLTYFLRCGCYPWNTLQPISWICEISCYLLIYFEQERWNFLSIYYVFVFSNSAICRFYVQTASASLQNNRHHDCGPFSGCCGLSRTPAIQPMTPAFFCGYPAVGLVPNRFSPVFSE